MDSCLPQPPKSPSSHSYAHKELDWKEVICITSVFFFEGMGADLKVWVSGSDSPLKSLCVWPVRIRAPWPPYIKNNDPVNSFGGVVASVWSIIMSYCITTHRLYTLFFFSQEKAVGENLWLVVSLICHFIARNKRGEIRRRSVLAGDRWENKNESLWRFTSDRSDWLAWKQQRVLSHLFMSG